MSFEGKGDSVNILFLLFESYYMYRLFNDEICIIYIYNPKWDSCSLVNILKTVHVSLYSSN